VLRCDWQKTARAAHAGTAARGATGDGERICFSG